MTIIVTGGAGFIGMRYAIDPTKIHNKLGWLAGN